MKILFDHQKKTGGTSIGDFLRQALGANRVSPLILDEAISVAGVGFQNFDVVVGHFKLSPDYRWPKDVYHVTVLRDPLERFLSHYSYVRGPVRATEPFAELARNHSIEELLEDDSAHFRAVCQDFYGRHFLYALHDQAEAERILLSGAWNPEELCEAIEERYRFVGLTEHLKLSIAAICVENSIRATLADRRSRPTFRRVAAESLAPPTRRKLDALLERDRQIYQHFQSRFFERLAGHTQLFLNNLPRSGAEGGEKVLAASGSAMQLVAVDLVCPEEPGNSIGIATKFCWLAAKFAVSKLPREFTLVLEIQNSLKQTMFSELRNIQIGEDPGEFLEFIWEFKCALGRDTYSVSLYFDEMGGDRLFVFDQFYHFAIGVPEQHNKGLCTLETDFHSVGTRATGARPAGAVKANGTALTAAPGALVELPVMVSNTGKAVFTSVGVNAVVASYRIAKEGSAERAEGRRTYLGKSLSAGTETDLNLKIVAPAEAGRWLIYPALVQERVSWLFVAEEPILLTVAGEAAATD